MNGPQDVGGRHGFGSVTPEADEPLFHSAWERKAMALTIAAGGAGAWTIDESRYARENRTPGEYYSLTYYALWLAGLKSLMLMKGLATPEELETGEVTQPLPPGISALPAERVPASLAAGTPYDRDPGSAAPVFAESQRVRTRNLQPRGHIRMPAYCRGKVGEITAIHGFHVFPDTSAKGDKSVAHWLYNVTFSARDLFGENARAEDTVSVDLWEPYLNAL